MNDKRRMNNATGFAKLVRRGVIAMAIYIALILSYEALVSYMRNKFWYVPGWSSRTSYSTSDRIVRKDLYYYKPHGLKEGVIDTDFKIITHVKLDIPRHYFYKEKYLSDQDLDGRSYALRNRIRLVFCLLKHSSRFACRVRKSKLKKYSIGLTISAGHDLGIMEFYKHQMIRHKKNKNFRFVKSELDGFKKYTTIESNVDDIPKVKVYFKIDNEGRIYKRIRCTRYFSHKKTYACSSQMNFDNKLQVNYAFGAPVLNEYADIEKQVIYLIKTWKFEGFRAVVLN